MCWALFLQNRREPCRVTRAMSTRRRQVAYRQVPKALGVQFDAQRTADRAAPLRHEAKFVTWFVEEHVGDLEHRERGESDDGVAWIDHKCDAAHGDLMSEIYEYMTFRTRLIKAIGA